jgi:hypothetical protein
MCICGVCVGKKRGGDRVSRREASPSCSCPSCSLARLYKGGGCALLPGCSVVQSSDHVPFVLRCHLNINVMYFVDLYLSSSQIIVLNHYQWISKQGGRQGVTMAKRGHGPTMVDTSNTAFKSTDKNVPLAALCLSLNNNIRTLTHMADSSPRKSQS